MVILNVTTVWVNEAPHNRDIWNKENVIYKGSILFDTHDIVILTSTLNLFNCFQTNC